MNQFSNKKILNAKFVTRNLLLQPISRKKLPATSYKLQANLVVILGPTGSGKTDLAIKLAKEFNGEIVCADARQVYKEMIVGTASPASIATRASSLAKRCGRAQLQRCGNFGQAKRVAGGNNDGKFKIKEIRKPLIIDKIPHHLFNIIEPNQEFNVAIYKKLAVKTIKDIQKRGKLPFLVGGTGLYIQAVVDNINFPIVAPQLKLREKLERKSLKELFEIYQKLDFNGAKFIDKKNKRRLVRAIEVCKITGNPFSQQLEKGKSLFNVLQIGLSLPKQELEKRIRKRTAKMMQMGLEKEAENLIKKYGVAISAMKTIGYQEAQDYFEKKISKKEFQELIILHTVQFTKRQMTWFKKDKKIVWVKNKKQAEKLIKIFLFSPRFA
ncbi:tRNA (adenosine(37)-N6)-dimethylallyltransferase MiaA [Patescibacteria group bacterium]|nr:tRNA (adenosine(37)-N6)-dimethylallyltransferase MiaA [Patescibacteria group bacterium]